MLRNVIKLVTAGSVFVAFVVINPLFVLGCGSQEKSPSGGECVGSPPAFDYTHADMLENIEGQVGRSHAYEAENDEGTLSLSIRIDSASIPERFTRADPAGGNSRSIVRAVAACSYLNSKHIELTGVFSATFEHSDGSEEHLSRSEHFEGIYLVESRDAFENGSISYEATDGPSFEVGHPSGVFEFFEIKRFDTPSAEEAQIARLY